MAKMPSKPRVHLTYGIPQEVTVTTTVTLHGESPEDPVVIEDVVHGILEQIENFTNSRIRVVLQTGRGHCCPLLFRSVQRAMNTQPLAYRLCLTRAGS